ncbi:MAG TPA: hypoxanthine phosphoribosyltransferase [Actinomycetota bacterium]|nr:hypoxanthine phosphoribosyltransferase [Actinomycetota bacterium]
MINSPSPDGIRGVVGSGATAEVLISAAEIAHRVDELGRELREVYHDAERPPVLVGVLKGSTLFLADLLRAVGIDAEVDFMAISSYSASAGQSGVVRIIKDLEGGIAGRDVLLVEDIVDTGLTLTYLRRALGERGPRSLRTVALLDKVARRIVPVPVEFRGFEIPDVFVVGYGLDFMGRYRNVPDLYAVRDLARLANDPMLLVGPFFGSDGRART